MNIRRRKIFQDKEHLVRMAGIFAFGIVAFLVLQMLLVPDTFGLYGHYRAAAIGDQARKPLAYAGRGACVFQQRADGGDLPPARGHARVCRTGPARRRCPRRPRSGLPFDAIGAP